MESNPLESVCLWDVQKPEIDCFKSRILDWLFFDCNPNVTFSGAASRELSELVVGKSRLFIESLKSIILSDKNIFFDIALKIDPIEDQNVSRFNQVDFDITCLGLAMSRDRETNLIGEQLRITPVKTNGFFAKCKAILHDGYPTRVSLENYQVEYDITISKLNLKLIESLACYLSADRLLLGYFLKTEAPSSLMRQIFRTNTHENKTTRGRPRMLHDEELTIVVQAMTMSNDEISQQLLEKPLLRDGFFPQNFCVRHDFAFRLILAIELIKDRSKFNSSLPIKDVWAACKANLDLMPIEYQKYCE